MSRSGYGECGNEWDLIRWRGAVKMAFNGKRGQAFLRECLQALDELPEKRLEESVLVSATGCCAMGAVAKHRGVDTSNVDAYAPDEVGSMFGIATAMAAEIAFENDEGQPYCVEEETPERRWERMRKWVASQIMEAKP